MNTMEGIIHYMITDYGNYISEASGYEYEDGIMNYNLFKNEKIKIERIKK